MLTLIVGTSNTIHSLTEFVRPDALLLFPCAAIVAYIQYSVPCVKPFEPPSVYTTVVSLAFGHV